jgi:hypothetical protein
MKQQGWRQFSHRRVVHVKVSTFDPESEFEQPGPQSLKSLE